MKKDFNVLREVIAQAKDSAEKELIHLEQNKTVSLIDVFREYWDDIEFLLAFFKKRHGSSYRHLAALFAKRGIRVSESTLRTTYFRINAEKNKKRQASKATPPNVLAPVVEVPLADPGAAAVSPLPEPVPTSTAPAVVDETPPQSPFEIDEELVESIDWATECKRLDEIHTFSSWNEEDQFIYCVIYWLAKKYETTIRKFIYVSMSTHPKDMNVSRTASLLFRRAKQCGMPVDVPNRFSSIDAAEDVKRVDDILRG